MRRPKANVAKTLGRYKRNETQNMQTSEELWAIRQAPAKVPVQVLNKNFHLDE